MSGEVAIAEHFAGTIIDRGRRVCRRRLRAFQSASTDDIEALHQLRVAIRRLRVALRVLRDSLPDGQSKRWRKRLGRANCVFGPARDLDVQIEFVRDYGRDEASREFRVELALFREFLQGRRDGISASAMKAAESLSSSRAMRDLDQWCDRRRQRGDRKPNRDMSIRPAAAKTILARIHDLLTFEPAVLTPNAHGQHHAMRIAAKRLRYTMEIFADLYPGGLDSSLATIKDFQTSLGDIHDCDVWVSLLASLMRNPETDSFRPALEHLLLVQERKRDETFQQFVADYRRRQGEMFWERLVATIGVGPDPTPESKRCQPNARKSHDTSDR